MTKVKPTAKEMKTLLMCYWRFQRQHYIVAQEFSYGSSDVISFSERGRKVFETEIKISIADMRRERHKTKHKFRSRPNIFGRMMSEEGRANQFYFAVPDTIENKAVGVCQELFPYAGLLVVDDCVGYLKTNPKPVSPYPIREVREATAEAKAVVDEKRIFGLARGMSNNLCTASYEVARLKRGFGEGTD